MFHWVYGVDMFVLNACLLLASVGLVDQDPVTVELVYGAFLPGETKSDESATSQLTSPFGIDFDAEGTMYIVELGGGRVWRLAGTDLRQMSGTGKKEYTGDGGPAVKAGFNGMHNLAIHQNRLFIADTWNHCVREIDLKTQQIKTFAGDGQAGFAGDDQTADKARFNYVMCVSLSPDHQALYIADLRNRRIRKIDLSTRNVTTIAGNGQKGVPQDGANAATSPLVDPRAVAVDAGGRVYVLERGGHALRCVVDGKITTVAGNGKSGNRDGAALEAQFKSPKHLCIDEKGRVYIADEGNATIRMYDPKTQSVTTLLGHGKSAPAVKLKNPHGVCIHNGKLYVVDTGHDRIFRMDLPK